MPSPTPTDEQLAKKYGRRTELWQGDDADIRNDLETRSQK